MAKHRRKRKGCKHHQYLMFCEKGEHIWMCLMPNCESVFNVEECPLEEERLMIEEDEDEDIPPISRDSIGFRSPHDRLL